MEYYGSQGELYRFASAFIGIFCGIFLLIFAAFYVFEAIGLYKLSKNRGYAKPWIAFIPVVNAWVLGGLADNINYCFGKTSRWRIILLITEAVWSLFYGIYLVMMLAAFPAMLYAAASGSGGYASVLTSSGWTQVMAVAPLVSLISLARLVLRTIATYKVYQDYNPKDAVLFLLLSILLGIGPFLLFALRNRTSATLYWKNQPRPPYPPPPYGTPPAPPQGGPGGPPFYPPQQ